MTNELCVRVPSHMCGQAGIDCGAIWQQLAVQGHLAPCLLRGGAMPTVQRATRCPGCCCSPRMQGLPPAAPHPFLGCLQIAAGR